MKKLCILSVLMVSLVVLTPFSLAEMKGSHAGKMAVSESSLYAVSFHADWCGSCKALEPNLVKARGKADLDNQNILFVKLDLTNATTRHQSSLMAEALSIGDFYANNNGKTGFVLLVSSKTGEVVGKLTKDMDASQMAQAIQEKVSAI